MKENNTGGDFLGVELGSTRIKAVIIGGDGKAIASGSCQWENRPLAGDVWTYDLADARAGLAAAYAACADDYAAHCGARPSHFEAIGISAMMHGYVVFDEAGRQLAPFRTWRSTNAARAGAELSSIFGIHLPNRWSVAQLYQSILDDEDHVRRIAFQTTLAGYVHFLLTACRVLGVNDASGMFPVDARTRTYAPRYVSIFREKTGIDVRDMFPKPLAAGADAGRLTAEGARLLDPSGADDTRNDASWASVPRTGGGMFVETSVSANGDTPSAAGPATFADADMATHGSSAASAIHARRFLSMQFLMAQLYHAARRKRKRVHWENTRHA